MAGKYEKALLDPAAVFSTPEQLLEAEGLAKEQKIEILRRWEYDSCGVAVAEEEGMFDGPSPLLHRILDALKALDTEIDGERRPPTKQGGV